MARVGDVLHNPVTGEQFTVLAVPATADGWGRAEILLPPLLQVDQVLFGLEVSCDDVGDESVGELVISVEKAEHFAFLNYERTALSHRRRGRDPQRLAGQAAFAQKIARPEKGNDCLFAFS